MKNPLLTIAITALGFAASVGAIHAEALKIAYSDWPGWTA